MPALRSVLLLPLAFAAAGPLAAQATRDQSRLVFNVGIGYTGGTDLWRVTGQPVSDRSSLPARLDSLTITRRTRPGLTFGVKGIYFRGDNFGITGEASLLGLGTSDECTRTYADPPPSLDNQEICTSIDQGEQPASAAHVAGGAIFRIASRRTISPYVRGAAGIVFTNHSYTAVTGTFVNSDNDLVDKIIYPADGNTRLNLAATLALGLTAALDRGYQLRWEVRDHLVGLPRVTGPSVLDGIAPPTGTRYRHVLSIEVGVDILLERRRGRRY